MTRRTLVILFLIIGVGVVLEMCLFDRRRAPGPEIGVGTVFPIVAAGIALLGGVTFLVLWQRRRRDRWTAREWMVVAIILALCAVPVGWLYSTTDLTLTWTILAVALLALVKALLTRASERTCSARMKEGCCPTCGYNLTGNASGICPECGEQV